MMRAFACVVVCVAAVTIMADSSADRLQCAKMETLEQLWPSRTMNDAYHNAALKLWIGDNHLLVEKLSIPYLRNARLLLERIDAQHPIVTVRAIPSTVVMSTTTLSKPLSSLPNGWQFALRMQDWKLILSDLVKKPIKLAGHQLEIRLDLAFVAKFEYSPEMKTWQMLETKQDFSAHLFGADLISDFRASKFENLLKDVLKHILFKVAGKSVAKMQLANIVKALEMLIPAELGELIVDDPSFQFNIDATVEIENSQLSVKDVKVNAEADASGLHDVLRNAAPELEPFFPVLTGQRSAVEGELKVSSQNLGDESRGLILEGLFDSKFALDDFLDALTRARKRQTKQLPTPPTGTDDLLIEATSPSSPQDHRVIHERSREHFDAENLLLEHLEPVPDLQLQPPKEKEMGLGELLQMYGKMLKEHPEIQLHLSTTFSHEKDTLSFNSNAEQHQRVEIVVPKSLLFPPTTVPKVPFFETVDEETEITVPGPVSNPLSLFDLSVHGSVSFKDMVLTFQRPEQQSAPAAQVTTDLKKILPEPIRDLLSRLHTSLDLIGEVFMNKQNQIHFTATKINFKFNLCKASLEDMEAVRKSLKNRFKEKATPLVHLFNRLWQRLCMGKKSIRPTGQICGDLSLDSNTFTIHGGCEGSENTASPFSFHFPLWLQTLSENPMVSDAMQPFLKLLEESVVETRGSLNVEGGIASLAGGERDTSSSVKRKSFYLTCPTQPLLEAVFRPKPPVASSHKTKEESTSEESANSMIATLSEQFHLEMVSNALSVGKGFMDLSQIKLKRLEVGIKDETLQITGALGALSVFVTSTHSESRCDSKWTAERMRGLTSSVSPVVVSPESIQLDLVDDSAVKDDILLQVQESSHIFGEDEEEEEDDERVVLTDELSESSDDLYVDANSESTHDDEEDGLEDELGFDSGFDDEFNLPDDSMFATSVAQAVSNRRNGRPKKIVQPSTTDDFLFSSSSAAHFSIQPYITYDSTTGLSFRGNMLDVSVPFAEVMTPPLNPLLNSLKLNAESSIDLNKGALKVIGQKLNAVIPSKELFKSFELESLLNILSNLKLHGDGSMKGGSFSLSRGSVDALFFTDHLLSLLPVSKSIRNQIKTTLEYNLKQVVEREGSNRLPIHVTLEKTQAAAMLEDPKIDFPLSELLTGQPTDMGPAIVASLQNQDLIIQTGLNVESKADQDVIRVQLQDWIASVNPSKVIHRLGGKGRGYYQHIQRYLKLFASKGGIGSLNLKAEYSDMRIALGLHEARFELPLTALFKLLPHTLSTQPAMKILVADFEKTGVIDATVKVRLQKTAKIPVVPPANKLDSSLIRVTEELDPASVPTLVEQDLGSSKSTLTPFVGKRLSFDVNLKLFEMPLNVNDIIKAIFAPHYLLQNRFDIDYPLHSGMVYWKVASVKKTFKAVLRCGYLMFYSFDSNTKNPNRFIKHIDLSQCDSATLCKSTTRCIQLSCLEARKDKTHKFYIPTKSPITPSTWMTWINDQISSLIKEADQSARYSGSGAVETDLETVASDLEVDLSE
eukprot:GILJ01004152.1.p1 GENE.GILJ01004152.1~~GILJ01004152.1.p1  ORF type:complete len:1527 (-),score=321.81 GILJ01004152.1:256-4836(-)